jgi:hypothetical protein
MCGPNLRTLRLWAGVGLVSALLQALMMALQYAHASSDTLLACLVASIIFAATYVLYAFRTCRLNPTTLRSDKYFLLIHVLIGTWYFWAALLTFVYHTVGLTVSDVLKPGAPDALAPRSIALLSVMFGLTVITHVVEIYCTLFHTRKMAAGYETTWSASDAPRYALIYTTIADIALICLTGWSYSIQQDHGTIILIIIGILSLAFQARQTVTAWKKDRAPFTAEQHMTSQLQATQHMLISSTIFLVNLVLIMVNNVGLSLPTIMASDNGLGEGALVIVSIVAYLGILASSTLLVSLHVTLELPKHHHDFDNMAFASSIMDWNSTAAVPVAIIDAESPFMAIPVALD